VDTGLRTDSVHCKCQDDAFDGLENATTNKTSKLKRQPISNKPFYETKQHTRDTLTLLFDRLLRTMKSASTEAEDTDVGSFFAVVLGTLLVAFVLPQLASLIFTPKRKEVESTSSMIEMRMAQREMYRCTTNATNPSVFERYEHGGDDSDDDGEEHDFDDEITVQSFLEVHKKGDFPEFRKEEEEVEEEEEEDKREEVKKEEITSSTNNWRCACENGFLPPGLLKTFGGAEAVIRMSTGQCFHKQ
jgi:hypothetical protein